MVQLPAGRLVLLRTILRSVATTERTAPLAGAGGRRAFTYAGVLRRSLAGRPMTSVQIHRRNNPSATTARTAATNAMSAPKIMSFRCRRRIAFYEVDKPRGMFAGSARARARGRRCAPGERGCPPRGAGPRRAAGEARRATPRCGRRRRNRVWVSSHLPPHRDLLVLRPGHLPLGAGIARKLHEDIEGLRGRH